MTTRKYYLFFGASQAWRKLANDLAVAKVPSCGMFI